MLIDEVELFGYQQAAFDAFMDRGSLLLALDTGLGKTITAIAICEDLLARRKTKTVIIVMPADLKYQWAKSISRFTDIPSQDKKVKRETIRIPKDEYCAIIDGTPERRAKLYEKAVSDKPEYILIGYDTVVSDYDEYLSQFDFTMAVLDEASKIRTPGAQRSIAIKQRLQCPYRLALTATPIENAPEDVFSIMEWVDRSVLGRFDLFDKAYIRRDANGTVMSYKNLDVLHHKLSSAMFRRSRTDPDVAHHMPKVEHHVWEVRTTPEILEAYTDMADDMIRSYASSPARSGGFSLSAHYGKGGMNTSSGMGEVMSIHTCMEMLLDYPVLIADSADKYQKTGTEGSKYAFEWMQTHHVPTKTPKKDFVVKQVNEILLNDPEAKVILFSRYKGMVNVLTRDLEHHNPVAYHGDMNNTQKAASVASFLDDTDTRVFISSHAGAYGTDLPVANWLINIDIPWGDGLATQINGRHVRASSDFACVNVVDVVTVGTIEERKVAVRRFKNDTAKATIDGVGKATVARDVKSLIKHAQEVVDASAPGLSEDRRSLSGRNRSTLVTT